MFLGSIPVTMQKIMKEIVSEWECSDIYFGCSGNFTAERAVASLNKPFSLHSNDVSIYSYVLGVMLSGNTHQLKVREGAELFQWMQPYLESPTDIAAAVTIASQIVNIMTVEGTLKEGADYFGSKYNAFKRNFPEAHAKTTEKLKSTVGLLASYDSEDVMTWIKRVPSDAGFMSYPPFFGSGGFYEKDLIKLDAVFDWPKPLYTILDDKSLTDFWTAASSREYWVLSYHKRLTSLEHNLRGKMLSTPRGMPVFLYAGNGPKRLALPHQRSSNYNVRRIMMDEITPDSKLRIINIKSEHFHAMRSQYMSKKIAPGSASNCSVILCDNKVIGAVALLTGHSNGGDTTSVYIMSDFSVAPTRYKHLSKLVVTALLSKEYKLMAENAAGGRRVESFATTAFTKRNVSMKYRGLLKMDKRKELDPDDPMTFGNKYMLNYSGMAGQWTLAEGLQRWLEKYGQVKN